MICVSPARAAVTAVVLLAAAPLATGCERRGSVPIAASTGISAAVSSAPQRVASTAAGTGVLVLGGKTVQLEARCVDMGDDVLVAAKTMTGDKGSVDIENGKVRYADFTVDGIAWMWEPTSTSGAPDPSITKDGKTYTVIGGVHQLQDYTKLSDYTFIATCPD